MREPTPLSPRDAEVVANATGYVVTVFLGRGHYAKTEHRTLAEARIDARQTVDAMGRPAMIYALMGERQCHLENVEEGFANDR